jgi:hypothetical protein
MRRLRFVEETIAGFAERLPPASRRTHSDNREFQALPH